MSPGSDAGAPPRGGFFMVWPDRWAQACDLGMNEAVAYLVLAQGTAGNNRTTSWSSEALHKYSGITWERGKAAIGRLISSGLLCYGPNHTPQKPRYEFTPPGETAADLYRAGVAALAEEDRTTLRLVGTRSTLPRDSNASIKRLMEAKLIEGRWKNNGPKYSLIDPPTETSKDPIWLPNTLVRGASEGESAPVKRIRQNGDVWALRLLVDLYGAHNLRDDGGINPSLIRQKFERKKIGEHGAFTIWGFKPDGESAWWRAALEKHKLRPSKEKNHPVWESVAVLRRTGLLSYVPHLWDNDPEAPSTAAEIIHPYGITGHGGEPCELEIGEAAHEAAIRMAYAERVTAAEDEGFRYLCPVRSSIPNACMIGVARLRYRPHTKRTGAWITELESTAPAIVAEFQAMGHKPSYALRSRVG